MAAFRMLDLFSGLGGASQAMIDDPEWEVIRIENNLLLQEVPGTLMLDVLEWADWVDSLGPFDLVWASPPCGDFSRLSMPWTREKLPDDFEPDMELIHAAREIISVLNPKWYVLENVRGARPYLDPLVGRPTQVIHAWHLWGRFPHLVMPRAWEPPRKSKDWNLTDPLRSNKRAIIPLEISQALKRAVEGQLSLDDRKARWNNE